MRSDCIIQAAALIVLVLFGVTPGRPAAADSGGAPLLRVALLQMDPDRNNQAGNMDKAETFCRQAAERGADIALMPEMWNVGYTPFDSKKEGDREAFLAQAVPSSHDSIQRFARLADELDLAIGVTYEQAWEPAPRNAITLFDRHGKEVFTYAKVHTCDFSPIETSMTPGEDFYVGELDARHGSVRVGAMICYDREQPESARILMVKGAEIILTPSACDLDEIRLLQFRIRAVENIVGVAMANYPRPTMNGRSVAYDSKGETLVLADDAEGLFMADFDLEKLRDHRRRTIWGAAYRRPHRYGALLSQPTDAVWTRKDGFGGPWSPISR